MTVDVLLRKKVEEALAYLQHPAANNYGKTLIVADHCLRMAVDCAVGRRIEKGKALRKIEIPDDKADVYFKRTWNRAVGVESALTRVLITDSQGVYFTPRRRELFLRYLNEVFDKQFKAKVKAAIRGYIEKYKARLLPEDIKDGENTIKALEAEHFPITDAYEDLDDEYLRD